MAVNNSNIKPPMPKTQPPVLNNKPPVPKNGPNIKPPAPGVPTVPMRPGVIKDADRKYATAIANYILHCNSALKEYKNVVERKSINFTKNKEWIIYAVCDRSKEDFAVLKENYKTGTEFLQKVDIDEFHDDKTPDDVKKSLDRIIAELKKPKSKKPIKKLTPSEKKIFVEEAKKFIEQSKFPNFIKTRCLPDICEFFEKNADILYHVFHKEYEKKSNDDTIKRSFQAVCRAIFSKSPNGQWSFKETSFYKTVKVGTSGLNTFKDFQMKFIKFFEICYDKYKNKLKPIN